MHSFQRGENCAGLETELGLGLVIAEGTRGHGDTRLREGASWHVGTGTRGESARYCSSFLVHCFLQRSKGRAWFSEPAVG